MPSDRVSRSEQQAIRSYDWLSRWYDWLSVKSEWPLTHAGLDALNLCGSERVLEIGPGSGIEQDVSHGHMTHRSGRDQ